ncbi:uncharacterized protein LOC142185071 [Leptodactylus fuscus]|uniref:uncharacterized protein LOC142185071 n=1 Tax=Leptodactylus fuscus TaxID=238119 RepID=UPI003F4EDC10
MEHTRKRASIEKSLRASSERKKTKPRDSSEVSSSSGGTCAHEDHVSKNDHETISNGEHGRTSKTKINSSCGDGNCDSTEGSNLEDDRLPVFKNADNHIEKTLMEIALSTGPVEGGLQKTLQEEGAHDTKRTKSQNRQSKSYTCVCGKSYSSSYNLHRHQKTHEISNGPLLGEPCEVKVTSEKSFSCMCGKSYTISSHLYRHQKTCQAVSASNLQSDTEESQLKPYACACGKRYTCSSHLYRHQRTHLDGSKESAITYICDCGKAFSNKSHLDQHQKTHVQEKLSREEHRGDSVEETGSKKPYVCICGKSYTCSSHLYRHQRTHQDKNVSGSSSYPAEESIMEKPYKCECGKSYTSKSHLYRHQRTHQNQELLVHEMDCDSHVKMENYGQKPYQCECGKSFVLWFSLMVHKKIHCKAKLQSSSASGQDRS